MHESEEDRLNADIRRHHIRAELKRAEREERRVFGSHLRRDVFLIVVSAVLIMLTMLVVILTEWTAWAV